jgi:hypothetical protein
MIGGDPPHLLGRHVTDRAHYLPGIGFCGQGFRFVFPKSNGGGGHLGQSKIQNLDLPIPREHDVAGLQVAVDDESCVGRRQSSGDLHGAIQRPSQAEWAPLSDSPSTSSVTM